MSRVRRTHRTTRPLELSSAAVRCLVPAGVRPATILQWLRQARRRLPRHAGSVSVVVVGPTEMARLNRQWRQKSGPTNVLSFTYQTGSPRTDSEFAWGEIFLCPAVIRREAKQQHREYGDYLRWLLQHGLIHLTGRDHQSSAELRAWQRIEKQLAR